VDGRAFRATAYNASGPGSIPARPTISAVTLHALDGTFSSTAIEIVNRVKLEVRKVRVLSQLET
jgi:hypothetical protein